MPNICKLKKPWYSKKQALFALAFHELMKHEPNNKLSKSSNKSSILRHFKNIKAFRQQYPHFDNALAKVLSKLNFNLCKQNINNIFKQIFPFKHSCLLHPISKNQIIILSHRMLGRGRYGRVKETQVIELINIRGKLKIRVIKSNADSVIKIQAARDSTINIQEHDKLIELTKREVSNLQQANRGVYWQAVSKAYESKVYLSIDKEHGVDGSDYIFNKKPITVNKLLEFYLEYLIELKKLHQLKVLHIDSRLENLKFNQHAAPGSKIRLIDFGISSKLDDKGQAISPPRFVSTKHHINRDIWVAPECYDDYTGDEVVSVKADIYSVGWNMLYKIPWYLQNSLKIEDFKRLAIRMIAEKPSERPSLDDCIKNMQNIILAEKKLCCLKPRTI